MYVLLTVNGREASRQVQVSIGIAEGRTITGHVTIYSL